MYLYVNSPSFAGLVWESLSRSWCDHPTLCLHLVTATARLKGSCSLYQSDTAFLRARPQIPHFMPSFNSFLYWMKENRWPGARQTSLRPLNAACLVFRSECWEHIAKANKEGPSLTACPSWANRLTSSTTSAPRPSRSKESRARALSMLTRPSSLAV